MYINNIFFFAGVDGWSLMIASQMRDKFNNGMLEFACVVTTAHIFI
jgi:hypothetical protein